MNERIVINLEQTDTKAYKTANLIQANAQESFEKLIKKVLSDIKTSKCGEEDCKDKNKNTIDRVHNTILINGKRGMGKTSFILSVEDAKKSDSEEKILKNICSLGIIDPTLIETKEHVLLNIITLIKDRIEDFIKCEKCDDKSIKYKAWKESLKKLAGGLSMLDGVGSNHLNDGMWDSQELILEKGLSNAKQGVDLEKNFHIFIDESLKIIEKEAFFLILDDIDTSLDKGTAILETLRKYLTSRKLIIAMLGDIDLYSTLVRQLQWEKMDPKKTLKDYEGTEKYLGQIEHLEEQYLTKVLKPENRIDLKNLFELKDEWLIVKEHSDLLEKNRNDKLGEESQNKLDDFEKNKKKRLQVEFESLKEPQELEKCVIDMIEKIYLTQNSSYTQYYERTLLTQSTRSVIQFLQVWHPEKGLSPDLIDRFRHTFYTTLKKKLGTYSLVELPNREKFLNLLAVYILNENFSKENHLKLTPNFAKDDDNITMLYLNMMANHLLEPQDYLSYFIKVGYAYEGYEKIELKEKRVEFIDNVVLDTRNSLSISEKILSSLKLESTTLRNGYRYFGNVFISSTSLKNQKNIDFLIQAVISKQKSYNFISFFGLLSYLTEIQNFPQDLIEWSKKADKIAKIPLYVLSKIWTKFAKTIYVIEDRSENNNKNYAVMFVLYVAGFLNAVYIEIELYENREKNRKNNSILNQDNVSTSSEYFYSKLKNDIRYDIDKDGTYFLLKEYENTYTLFDYLFECPLLQLDSKYFIVLANIDIDANDDSESESEISDLPVSVIPSPKIDFATLSSQEQKEIIKQIKGWESYAIVTIANYLRYWLKIKYKNVSLPTLRRLIKEMKKEI